MVKIVSTQNINFGQPRIDGTGVSVRVIAGRFKAGESVDELAQDYKMTREEIEACLRYELTRTHKRPAHT